MRKKITILTLLSMFLFAMTVFAGQMKAEDAQQKAASLVPAGSRHLYTKSDTTEFDVQFINEATSTNYEIKVSRVAGNITEFKARVRGVSGSNNIVKSENDAKNIVLMQYSNAVIKSISLETSGAYKKYAVQFTAGAANGEMKINPESGLVIEQVLKY